MSGLKDCSCGCAAPHVIAERWTADYVRLALWSDGDVTLRRLGNGLRGLGRPRSDYGRRAQARAVRLVADSIAAFDAAEVPTLIRAAAATYAHTYSSENDRRTHAIHIANRKLAALAAETAVAS